MRADATARDSEEEMEDYYENISEISSSPTSIATDAMPHHIASFFEQFNIKERQEIVCYYMKASKDKSTGLVATKAARRLTLTSTPGYNGLKDRVQFTA